MPWTKVIVSRFLCDNAGKWKDDTNKEIASRTLMPFDECKQAAFKYSNEYISHGIYSMLKDYNYDCFITCIRLRPLIFKNRNWKWCTKESFEVYIKLEKPFHGINELKIQHRY